MIFWISFLLLPAIFFAWNLVGRRSWKWYWKIAVYFFFVILALKDFLLFSRESFFYLQIAPSREFGIFLGLLLAVVELSFPLLLLKEAFRLVARKCHWRWPDGIILTGILTVVLLLSIAGIWNGMRLPVIRTTELAYAGLPKGLDGMKILFISDLHAGNLHNREFVGQVVNRAMAVRPDLILLGGDIIDRKTDLEASVIKPLTELRAPLGVYTVFGNHEYYSGFSLWRNFYADSQIELLENTSRKLQRNGDDFFVAGVTDEAAKHVSGRMPDLDQALSGVPRDAFSILLYHRPKEVQKSAESGVDLRLSGHTHGGIMPLLAWYIGCCHDGYVSDWYRVGEMRFCITPGAGIWSGIPLRLKGVPVMEVITLKRQQPISRR